MAWPLIALLAAQAAGNIGSAYANRPVRRRLPIEEIMARGQQDVLQGANRATANLGTSLAPALSVRRLNTSGIGPSLLTRANTEMVGGGLADLARKRSELQVEQSQLDWEDKKRKREWLMNLLMSLGQTAGEGAAGFEQESQIKELQKQTAGGFGQESEIEKLRRMLARLSQGYGGAAGGGYGGQRGYGGYGGTVSGLNDLWPMPREY